MSHVSAEATTLILFVLYVLYKEVFTRILVMLHRADVEPETRLSALRERSSGEQPISFWQKEFRDATIESFNRAFRPIMDNQTRILEELTQTQHEIATGVTKLLERVG